VSQRTRKHSAVTTGRKLFIDGDPLSAWGRRYRDIVAEHCSDLGGHDQLSAAELSLVRRSSALECECERMEAALSRGEPVDLDLMGRLGGQLRRLLESLHANALKRRTRPVPTLAEYLASQNLTLASPYGVLNAPETGREGPPMRSPEGAAGAPYLTPSANAPQRPQHDRR
jgi:hypothetical protein